jgi:uncharacterized protein YndB with AHSA1/START domain
MKSDKAAGLAITTPGDREIRVERVFNASRERVWRAYTEPTLIAQWWGRGRKMTVERMEVKRGGRWRFVVEGEFGVQGFEGRYREVTAPERLVQTFEWDGAPGHVVLETIQLIDLGNGQTRVVNSSLTHTAEERQDMLRSGMQKGVEESFAALDRLLASL